MKLAQFLLLPLALSSINLAQARDVFFENGTRFIKTDLVSIKNIPSVIFSGCKADEKLEIATCTQIAAIHQTEFSSMRTCENVKAGGRLLYSGFAGFMAGQLFGSSRDARFGLSFLGVAGGAAGSFFINKAIEEKMDVYSEKSERDVDYSTTEQDYATFVRVLKESLVQEIVLCDVSGATEAVSSTPYRIKLTNVQKQSLIKGAAAAE